MNRTITWLGGRAPPSRKTLTPASGSRSRASARGFRARGPSAAAAHRSSAPGAAVHRARPAEPSAARSPPCTRSSRRSTRWPPTATDARLGAPIPAGPRVPGLPERTGSTFPWPHPLKRWSLRESRGGSGARKRRPADRLVRHRCRDVSRRRTDRRSVHAAIRARERRAAIPVCAWHDRGYGTEVGAQCLCLFSLRRGLRARRAPRFQMERRCPAREVPHRQVTISTKESLMSRIEHANMRVILEIFSAIERRDQQRLVELCHSHVEFRWPPVLPYGGTSRGLKTEPPSWGHTWIPLQPTEAERKMDPRVVGANDDEVVVLWRQRGISPGGDRLDSPVLALYEIRDGKLTRAQMFYFDPTAVVDFLATAKSLAA